ncbi:hypothetical protein JG687_00003132 [Phytophthora cactorum]|uniref:Uncharacterized protein n=1 Tax=Phytophthora cactorum TaxID=29920 RepID=A0A329SZK0_9STRA|nr:hypothetical protein PC112_g2061 [Phytophthora cactorum]KAG2845783.1 hypothetical protein PC111_g1472 [Phytophthora cactorum]KAG2867150.1 hypothetical protein PC113_g2182 [Phytophthora cactorum]KAG2931031.1 hypothetical protein PC114_g2292 [Phytophthora cactorum]KAG2942158.1 hypothetical protein PC115_g1551 [Phytophthora cactorum]
MFQFYSAAGPKLDEKAADIERYRARHRRMCRGQQLDATPSPQVEDLDVEDGRTRKISAKWRQQTQPQQVPVCNQFHDGAEMHMGFNAFDFSASPEAFNATGQQMESKAASPSCQDNQDTGDKNNSLWERRFPGLRQPGRPVKQLPTLGQDALWGGRVHYTTQDAQRQTLYYQPQYYA